MSKIENSTAGSSTLRERLFENYHETQGKIASTNTYVDVKSAWPYFEANYRTIAETIPRNAKILEIGCGQGSLLAWMQSLGFENLSGVDASPGDVAFANDHLGGDVVTLDDGLSYLKVKEDEFDYILMKAILEHQPKEELLPLLSAVASALKPTGVLLVDVPNMDWLFASHERYMDLTHEVGFTRESLRSLLSLCFGEIEVKGSVPASLTRSQRWFRAPLIQLLRRLFYILGEGGNDFLFESRSLIAVARRGMDHD